MATPFTHSSIHKVDRKFSQSHQPSSARSGTGGEGWGWNSHLMDLTIFIGSCRTHSGSRGRGRRGEREIFSRREKRSVFRVGEEYPAPDRLGPGGRQPSRGKSGWA